MDLPKNPFKAADDYIAIRDVCVPELWTTQMQRINDMILMPLIALFMFFSSGDLMMFLSTAMTGYRVWSEWLEYSELQFTMQRMRIRMAVVGGPFIVTNDPKYMPYVWADAVVRGQTTFSVY
jgi:hypothetical protein